MFNLNEINVLLVEDDVVSKLMVSKFLEKWNARVSFSEDGENAIRMSLKHYYDIILMDLHLSDMSGFECAKKIKSIEIQKATPIIALSAFSKHEIESKIAAFGISDYINKPFDPRMLNHKIAQHTCKNKNQSSMISINLDKVQKLIDNDADFLKEFVSVTRKAFQEFSEHFCNKIADKDIEALKQVRHRILPTLKLLDLIQLDEIILSGISLIKPENNDKDIAQFINKIQSLCFEIDKALSNIRIL